jgi:GNAT superfamily N-acetyltransferase
MTRQRRRIERGASPAEVAPLGPADEPAWRRLWDAYLGFYEGRVGDEVTDHLWRSLVSGDGACRGYGARLGTELAGFAIVIVHPATWTLAPTAYLEDLFVRGDLRGQGAGRALMDALVAEAKTQGWASLYWHTHQGNRPARALYDRFARADEFVRYRLPIRR